MTLADDFRQAKVADLHHVVAGDRAILLLFLNDKNISRLKIAMEDSFVMRGFNAGADLSQQRERALHRDRAFASQELIKRFALDVFHHQKKDAFFTLAK